MPPMEEAWCYHTAILWPFSSYDSYGNPVVGSPIEISVRWVDSQKESVGSQGTPITVDATAVVLQDIAIGSEMWLGTLEDWYGTGSSGINNKVMYVKSFNSTKDIKQRVARRSVDLMRRHSGSP